MQYFDKSSLALCTTCLNFSKSELCNTCYATKARLQAFHTLPDNPEHLLQYLAAIKSNLQKDEKVLVGVSGGVDSSFIAVACGEVGLPTQLIHFDNGWNTQLASRNIKNIVDKYDFNLHTYIQHWQTFKSLQRSFLFSGVPDIELLTDHAIFSILARYLVENKNIKYVLSGSNFTTEHGLCDKFTWNKWDTKNIIDINQKHENISLENYPTISMFKWIYHRKISRRQKILVPLNCFYYKRSVALDYLGEKVSFLDYEFKHEESLLTKVFQRIILPKKYSYYKIKDHLSALIRNNEISKREAQIRFDNFKDASIDDYEMNFFLAKLELTDSDWRNIIQSNIKRHDDYSNNKIVFNTIGKVARWFNLRSMT